MRAPPFTRSKNESIQDALKLIQYSLQSCISIYGPLKPAQPDGSAGGYVEMMKAEMMKTLTFEDWQMYFTLLKALELVDSVTT